MPPQYFQRVIPHQFDSCPDKLILKAYQVKYNPKKMKRSVPGGQGTGTEGVPESGTWPHLTPLCRLEKEYAAMKSKEMEEQIEIKVSRGSGGRDGVPLGGQPCPSRTQPVLRVRGVCLHTPALPSPAGRRVSKGPPHCQRPVADKVDRSPPSWDALLIIVGRWSGNKWYRLWTPESTLDKNAQKRGGTDPGKIALGPGSQCKKAEQQQA